MRSAPELAAQRGYRGVFTREQAAGAIANGTRVVKVRPADAPTEPITTNAGGNALTKTAMGKPWERPQEPQKS
jgi:hypothetical protein